MDPFMYLTVPLPIAQHREFKFQFIPRDPEQESVKGRLLIPANASFMAIKDKLGKLMNCNPQHVSSSFTGLAKFSLPG
jgi:ubiquitin carboxyl-terminal hydrolase 4/11/15